MALVFRPPKRRHKCRILKSKERDLFQRLEEFVTKKEPELIRLLESTWIAQGNILSYEQIQAAYYQGDFTGEVWLSWEQLYSEMILERMSPLWDSAAMVAMADISVEFSVPLFSGADFGGDYFKKYGGNLITNLANSQREAIQMTLWNLYQNQNFTAIQASYYLRPLIGLTTPQIKANTRYYENTWQAMLGENPNLLPDQAQERAREFAEKYAAKQHRYRAQMIARTELTTFFNAGHDLAIEEAMALGLLPDMDCIWSTSANESTCDLCSAMEGERVPKGKPFSNGLKFPPVHPHCGCVVMYEPHEDLTNGENNTTMDRIKEVLTKDGITISNISQHAIERMEERGVSVSDVINTLQNPLMIGKIVTDIHGRESKKYFGEFSTVAINPDTGNYISTWKTSSKKREQLNRRKNNENNLD